MNEPPLGPLARTVLSLVCVASVGVAAVVWGYLYADSSSLLEAVVGVLPPATIAGLCGYYALRG